MAEYVAVQRRVWHDEKLTQVSGDARCLYLYLLTCPHGNMLGCFVLPKLYACADLEWLPERFDKPFAELTRAGLVKHDPGTNMVLIPKYVFHNSIQNPNQVKAANKVLDRLPRSSLLLDLAGTLEQLGKPFLEPLIERLRQPVLSIKYSVEDEDEDTRVRAREGETPEPPPPDPPPPSDDPEWTFLFTQVFQGNVNHIVRDELAQACDEFGVELVKEAMRRALENANGPPRQYLRGIFDGWREAGVFTMERLLQVDEEHKRRIRRRDPPGRKPRESAAERLLRQEGVI